MLFDFEIMEGLRIITIMTCTKEIAGAVGTGRRARLLTSMTLKSETHILSGVSQSSRTSVIWGQPYHTRRKFQRL